MTQAIQKYDCIGILVNDPGTHNYENFFSDIFQNIRNEPKFIRIRIAKHINNSISLNKILNSIYYVARQNLMKKKYDDTEVIVYYNDMKYILENDSKLFALKPEEQLLGNVKEWCGTISFLTSNIESTPESYDSLSPDSKFEVVAVGGTFDHIHEGHKILLSVAAFLTAKLLIIGVTDQDLLKNKKYAEVLESYEKRCQNVTDYLKIVSPDKNSKIFKIEDICGPTGYLENIDALVLSAESRAGGKFVNDTRKSKGFKELSIHEIDVIGGGNENDWQGKLSSTDLRKRDYEKQFKKVSDV